MSLDTARIKGLIGLCARARQVVLGEDGCLSLIRSGRAALVLIDEQISANGEKRYTDACRTYGVKLKRLPPGLIGAALGKQGRMAAAFSQGGLTKQLMELTGATAPERAGE